MRYTIIILVITILLFGINTQAFCQDLPYSVTVKSEAEEEPQMETIEKALITSLPAKEKEIKQALEELEEIIDETMEKGQSVTLYPNYIFEIAKKALEKNMAAKDIGELLEEYQEAIIEGESATKIRRIIIEGLDKSLNVDKIIKQFEEKEEEEEEKDKD